MLLKTFLFLILTLLFFSCQNTLEEQNTEFRENYFQVKGYAQGTTYSIIYEDEQKRDLTISIDSILKAFDQELSIYVDSSIISKVNRLEKGNGMNLANAPLFIECFRLAKEVYKKTDEAFNPAIYPLVKYWGFLNFEQEDEDHLQTEIDSLLNLIDFSNDAITLNEKTKTIIKQKTSNFDFNAIAQGYSVDVVAEYLNNLVIKNYMVEIGGELKTKGINNKGKVWKIGIDKPIDNSKPGEREFQIIVKIGDLALATSGNYRKFYEKDGIKYAHTINPKTGKPVEHQLLSTTVVTPNCALADAYATAFMVMGVEGTKAFLEKNKELKLAVYLIYGDKENDWSTWQTKSFDALIVTE